MNCIADHVAVQTMCKAQDVRALRGKLPEPGMSSGMSGLQAGKGAMVSMELLLIASHVPQYNQAFWDTILPSHELRV